MTGRTEIRVREIRRRTRRYRQRRENRELFSLTAFGLFLLAGISVLLQGVQAPGVSAVAEGYGSVLLREDAGGYVLVAVVSFAAAAAITALCFRLRIRENQKKDGTDKPDPQEQEEKSQ